MPPPLVQEIKSAFDDEGIQAHLRALREIRDLEREIDRMARRPAPRRAHAGTNGSPSGGPSGGPSGDGASGSAPALPRVPREQTQAMKDLREMTALARIEFDKLNLANRRGEITNEQFHASVSELRARVTRDLAAVRNQFESVPRAMEIQYGRSLTQLEHFATRAQEVMSGHTRLRTRITQGIKDAAMSSMMMMPGGMPLMMGVHGAHLGFGALAAGAVGIGGALATGKAAAMAIRYEKALSEVRKTTGMSAEATERLGDDLLDLSAKLGSSEMDLAAIAASAGQLGITGARNITAFTETVAKFSAVSEMTAAEAADALGKVGVAFGIPVQESERLGSVINELSNDTAASSADIVDALNRIGPAGKSIGLTADESAALAATLIETGQGAERAGTSLRNVFTRMRTEAADIAKTMGITRAEFDTMVSKDAMGAIEAYLGALNQMPENLRVIKIKETFGDENVLAVLGLAEALETGADGVSRLSRNLQTSGEAWTAGTSLTREYAAALDTVSGQWGIFAQRFKGGVMAVGAPLASALKTTLRAVNEMTGGVDDAADAVSRLRGEASDLRAMHELTRRYEDAKTGSDEWRKALDELAERYPDYVTGYDALGRATGIYADELRRATEERIRLTKAEIAANLEDIGERFSNLSAGVRERRGRQAQLEGDVQAGRTTQVLPWSTLGASQTGQMGPVLRNLVTDLQDVRQEANDAELELAKITSLVAQLFDPASVSGNELAEQLGLTQEEATQMVLRLRQIAQARRQAAAPVTTGDGSGDGPGTPISDADAARLERAKESAQALLRAYADAEELARTDESLKTRLEDVHRLNKEILGLEEQLAGLRGTQEGADLDKVLKAKTAKRDAAREGLKEWEEMVALVDAFQGLEPIAIDFETDAAVDALGRVNALIEQAARDVQGVNIELGFGRLTPEEAKARIGAFMGSTRENLRRIYDEWKAILPPEVVARIEAFLKGVEDGADGAAKKAKSAGEAFRAMAGAGRGLLRLGDALGVVSDRLSDIAGGALDAIDAMGDLAATRAAIKAGDLSGMAATASTTLGYVGVAAGVASMLAGVLSGVFQNDAADRQREAEERQRQHEETKRAFAELAQSLRDNARSVAGAINRLINETRIGGGVSGETAQAAGSALARFRDESGGAQREIRGLEFLLADLDVQLAEGIISLEDYNQQREDLLRRIQEQENRVREAFDALVGDIEASGLLTEEETTAIRDLFQDLTRSGYSVQDAITAILEGTAAGMEEGLRELIERVTSSLGGFAATVDGAIAGFGIFQRLLGQDLPTALMGFIDLLEQVPGLSDPLKELLAEARGLAADGEMSEGDQARIQEIARLILQRVLGADTGFLGGLTPEQAQAIAEALLAATTGAEVEGPDGEMTRSVQIMRTITEIQANELVAQGDEGIRQRDRVIQLLASAVALAAHILGAVNRIAPPVVKRPGGYEVTGLNGAAPDAITAALASAIDRQTALLRSVLAQVTAARPLAIGPAGAGLVGATVVNVGGITVGLRSGDRLTEAQIQQVMTEVGRALRDRARNPFNPLGR